MSREDLLNQITAAKEALITAENDLFDFDAKACNNVFETLNAALDKVERTLHLRARGACEGSGNCGMDSYEQRFMVGNIEYVGYLECEYNRHDKQYYYIESSTFAYQLVDK